MRYDPADENRFDLVLEEGMPDFLPDDVVNEVTPWKKAMHRVLIGLALTAITLNFWGLNLILPFIGHILLLLGFRTLRCENGWFNGCYVLSIVKFSYNFSALILNATIYSSRIYDSPFTYVLSAVGVIIQFATVLFLWQGIKSVQRKAGLEEGAGGAVGLVVWYSVVCVFAIFGQVHFIVAVIIFVAYICIIRNLWKLSDEMDEAGYMIKAALIRISDLVLICIMSVILTIGLIFAYVFCGEFKMDWKPKDTSQSEQIETIKEHLISLGFPEAILEDMTDEDIISCDGALQVVVDSADYPANDGRWVEERTDTSIHSYMVFDQKELRITGIGVLLPGEREQWKIIHHFLWTIDPGFYGTESIQLWPAYETASRVGWGKASDFTGQVLYDDGDTTFVSPYYTLGEETYTSDSIFWGQNTETDVFAEFSMPRGVENHRGYISYTIKETFPGSIVDAWINYTHQQTWMQYPAMTAKEKRMSNGWNDAGAFKTIQDALQFFPYKEDPLS
ncbi:MAG: hypothetical protein E7672_00320 [Ruminococcaceae bacterium]|nr:hypothetical protein [Oscillospiraceae bacterium]